MSRSSYLDKLSYPEKRMLTEALQHLLIEEQGAYTLFGTKPLTAVFISPSRPQLSNSFIHSFFTSFSPELRKNILWKDSIPQESWDLLIDIARRLHFKNYKLVKRRFISFFNHSSDLECILFININEMRYILSRYYQDFQEVTGIQFQIESVLNDISNPDSVFWEKVFKHEALSGLVYGYGYINSWVYHWKNIYQSQEGEKSEYFKSLSMKASEAGSSLFVEDLLLPHFAYVDDKKIMEYKTTQQKIKKLYKAGDFLEITLKQFLSK